MNKTCSESKCDRKTELETRPGASFSFQKINSNKERIKHNITKPFTSNTTSQNSGARE